MVEYVKGDITEVKHGIICHQVNCMLIMGAGLAKQLRRKWPLVYSAYRNMSHYPPRQRLGKCQIVEVTTELYVANLFGQFAYGRHTISTDYGALTQAIQKLSAWHEAYQPTVPIYIPYKIGCGLAGGDWNIVQTILSANLQNYIIVKR